MKRKVAIVTGSSRGIGKAIAWKFAENNFDVVLNSKKSNLNKLARDIQQKTGVKTLEVKADVSTGAGSKKLIKETIAKLKRIDVLINNAGVYIDKPIDKTSEKEYDYIVDSNLKSTFLCCKEAVPYMMKNVSGAIINISSIAGKQGFADISAYCASKFGQIGITESLAEELRAFRIKVIAICPGEVATDMQRQYRTEAEYQRLKNSMIQPEEVADITLAATKGKYKTGKAIDVY